MIQLPRQQQGSSCSAKLCTATISGPFSTSCGWRCKCWKHSFQVAESWKANMCSKGIIFNFLEHHVFGAGLPMNPSTEVINKLSAAKITQRKDSYLERTLAPAQSYFCLSMINSGLVVQRVRSAQGSFCREADTEHHPGASGPVPGDSQSTGTLHPNHRATGCAGHGGTPKIRAQLLPPHRTCPRMPPCAWGFAQMLLEPWWPWCSDHSPGEPKSKPRIQAGWDSSCHRGTSAPFSGALASSKAHPACSEGHRSPLSCAQPSQQPSSSTAMPSISRDLTATTLPEAQDYFHLPVFWIILL